MKKTLHRADSRGRASFGWLESHHSFSFGHYHDPERMHFGALRVLNDDRVAPGRGFDTHSHRNMEIISIPLRGDLEHQDSMGNTSVIRAGDVQVMSAGKGVAHSEYNKNADQEVAFLQIWIIPDRPNVDPRYDQVQLDPDALRNRWHPVLGPRGKHPGLWIHQDAWFHLGDFESGQEPVYTLRDPNHGVYVFVIEGSAEAGGEVLHRRDGLGVEGARSLAFRMLEPSRLLLMEVPLIG
jgi:redox-sensitive bicupin YhaK (pirin superfamily)